jgi:HD-GYP domain-containing protein (c-di-GMP phosphodiesterase class II)
MDVAQTLDQLAELASAGDGERLQDYEFLRRDGVWTVQRGGRRLALVHTTQVHGVDLTAYDIAGAGRRSIVLVGEGDDGDFDAASYRPALGYLHLPATRIELAHVLRLAFDTFAMLERVRESEAVAFRSQYELGELLEIAAALSTERDLQKLLDMILEKSCFISGADAGSLYLVELREPKPTDTMTALTNRPVKYLRFAHTRNDSVPVRFEEFTLSLDSNSIAGYVAETGRPLNIPDVANMPPGLPFTFSRRFDQRSGYHTVSVLSVPMRNRLGDATGVIQLINRKRQPREKLTPENTMAQVIPFDDRTVELLTSLASQAAISLENARLLETQKVLFEGFVEASVLAIEQRDPTTQGHSRRVSKLCVGLARAVDRVAQGPFREQRFTPKQIKELEYAGLLHDFGKVGVREEVLVKAKKLYPDKKALIDARFHYVKKVLENEDLERKVRYLLERSRDEALGQFPEWDRELADRLREMDEFLHVVATANEPRVLAGGDYEKLGQIAARTFQGFDGTAQPLLAADEVKNLQIPRGSLNAEERKEIESHVTHTIHFLRRIPWTPEFRDVARIAGAHHEKLTGRGYPYGLPAEDIPVQSRIMTVADIFDALTASDRPYKVAVPVQKALDILGMEVKDGNVDGDLVRLFAEAKVYEIVLPG